MRADQVRHAFSRVGTKRTVIRRKHRNQNSKNLEGSFFVSHVITKKTKGNFVNDESVGELFTHISHNQRLEFLGDSVLEYMVTSHLYLMVTIFTLP